MIVFTSNQAQDLQELKQICLPCPRTGSPLIYYTDAQSHLYEMQAVAAGRKSSWMLNGVAYKDGTIRLVSQVDPLFIAIPILNNARQHADNAPFRTLDDIFSQTIPSQDSTQVADISVMLSLEEFTDQLNHICEVKEAAPGLEVYRLCDEKVLAWLQKKTETTVSQFDTIPTLASTIPNMGEQEQASEKRKACLLESAYLLSKYLSDGWFKRLLDHYELSEPTKEELSDISNYLLDTSTSAYFRPKAMEMKEEQVSKKAKKAEVPRSLAKVNTKGMKSLTSFFQKK